MNKYFKPALFGLFSLAILPALAQKPVQKEKTKTEYEEIIVDPFDVGPKFPGGDEALIKFIQEHLKYNQAEVGTENVAILSFVVMKDGSIGNIKVLKSLGPTLDNAAIAVIKEMPKWKPGSDKGKIVPARYTLPIRFSNKQSSKKVKHKTKR